MKTFTIVFLSFVGSIYAMAVCYVLFRPMADRRLDKFNVEQFLKSKRSEAKSTGTYVIDRIKNIRHRKQQKEEVVYMEPVYDNETQTA